MLPKNLIIAISGIDGCGKTTIIDELRKVLSERGKSSKYVWLRYNHYLTKFLLVFCRLVGLTKYEIIENVRVGYHEFYRSRLISLLFILLTYIDTCFSMIFKVHIPAILSQKVIICDRAVLDVMVDLEVDTRIPFCRVGFLRRAYMRIMPADSYYFLIDRDGHDVIESKPENAIDRNFHHRLRLYEIYSQNLDIKVINNDGPIGSVVERIISELN